MSAHLTDAEAQKIRETVCKNFSPPLSTKPISRLLSKPDTLCAQVLRAKYYPTGDLLNAGPKKGHPLHGKAL
jgi:hypothetical protein